MTLQREQITENRWSHPKEPEKKILSLPSNILVPVVIKHEERVGMEMKAELALRSV